MRAWCQSQPRRHRLIDAGLPDTTTGRGWPAMRLLASRSNRLLKQPLARVTDAGHSSRSSEGSRGRWMGGAATSDTGAETERSFAATTLGHYLPPRLRAEVALPARAGLCFPLPWCREVDPLASLADDRRLDFAPLFCTGAVCAARGRVCQHALSPINATTARVPTFNAQAERTCGG